MQPRPVQRALARGMRHYLPYLLQNRRFDRRNVWQALGHDGSVDTPEAEAALERQLLLHVRKTFPEGARAASAEPLAQTLLRAA